MDFLCFCFVFCLLCLCTRLFICALWSSAGKGLTSWLSFVVSTVSLSLSHWYPGSGVVLDCIDSWSLHPYLLWKHYFCYLTIIERTMKKVLLLVPMCKSVIVLCFVVRYFMFILVLKSPWWGRELVALLSLSSWCLVMVVWLFLAVS